MATRQVAVYFVSTHIFLSSLSKCSFFILCCNFRSEWVFVHDELGNTGSGIEFRLGRYFLHLSRPTLGPTQPLLQLVRVPVPGSKAAGAWRWSLTHPRLVKVKVKLSRYRPGWAVGVLRCWGSKICRQSAHEGGKVVSPTQRPSLPPRTSTSSVEVEERVELFLLSPSGHSRSVLG